jgi:hypothetical protein
VVVIEGLAVRGHPLAVALHLHLLHVRGEAAQRLRVREERARAVLLKVEIPHAEQAHQHGQVPLERRRRAVHVDRARAVEEVVDGLGAERERDGQLADRRGDGETAAHPVPEGEDARRRHAPARGRGGLARARDEVRCVHLGRGRAPRLEL